MSSRASMFVLLAALGCPSLPQMATGTDARGPVAARFNDEGIAYTADGHARIELRELRVEDSGPLAKPMAFRILVLFEPQTGAFSWEPFTDYPPGNAAWQVLAFKSYRATYMKDNRLVTFSVGRGPGPIYIQDLGGKASSLADAESEAIDAAVKLNRPPGAIESVQPSHVVPLPGLGREFVSPPAEAELGETPKVTGVKWDGKHWALTLKARWTEEITLDANYNLLSMQKVE